MEGRHFDGLVKWLVAGGSRRTLLKGVLGIGGVAATGMVIRDTDAARRGDSGSPTTTLAPTSTPSDPPPPIETPVPTPPCSGVLCTNGCCDGVCTIAGVCCPAGSTACGPDCCPNGIAQCCENACCFGICYGEELCCPETSMCGQHCCAPTDRCCLPANGQEVCIPADGCCSDDECEGGFCVDTRCVSDTEHPDPTSTPVKPTVALELTSS